MADEYTVELTWREFCQVREERIKEIGIEMKQAFNGFHVEPTQDAMDALSCVMTIYLGIHDAWTLERAEKKALRKVHAEAAGDG